VSVEAMVEDVVAGYHSGFSTSIQNYSRILALFSDAQSLVASVTSCLEEAGSHLASRKPALQAQWMRAATSAATVRILDAAAAACAYEERVGAALRDERPLDAVAGAWKRGSACAVLSCCIAVSRADASLRPLFLFFCFRAALLEAGAALEREELRAIPGLRSVRAAVAERRGSLFSDLLAQLLRAIYAPEQPAGRALLDAPAGDAAGGGSGGGPGAAHEGAGAGAGGAAAAAAAAAAVNAKTLNPLAAAAASKAAAAADGGSSGGGDKALSAAAARFEGGVEGVRLGLERFHSAKAAAARAAKAGGAAAPADAAADAAAGAAAGAAAVEALVDAMIRLAQGPGAVRDALSQRHPGQLRCVPLCIGHAFVCAARVVRTLSLFLSMRFHLPDARPFPALLSQRAGCAPAGARRAAQRAARLRARGRAGCAPPPRAAAVRDAARLSRAGRAGGGVHLRGRVAAHAAARAEAVR
jgi:hypothetical protein